MQYSSRTPEEALAWQRDLRAKLFSILKMDDLVSRTAAADFSTETVSSEKSGNYELRGLAIDSTPGRRIEITATVPTNMKGPFPAVVAVDGHSGTRQSCYEPGHCMCWKFPGLRALVDFTDIYSLIAPRPLLCQNGLKEDPSWFPVCIAREEIEAIKVIYADMECPQNVSLVAHDGGHEINLPSLLSFFDQHLQFPAT